jgi:hypothetical protein
MRTAHRLLSAATAATLLASGAILGAASATAAASSTTLPVASPWPGPDRQILVHAIPGCVATTEPGREMVHVSTRDPAWDAQMIDGWGSLLRGVTFFTTATAVSWRNLDSGATGGGLGWGANGSSESQEFMRTGTGRVVVEVDVLLGLPGGVEFGSLGTRTASTTLEVTVPACG